MARSPVNRPETLATGQAMAHRVLAPGASDRPRYEGLDQALQIPTSKVRLFGKPTAHPNRRMGVALALGNTVDEARERAIACAQQVQVVL